MAGSTVVRRPGLFHLTGWPFGDSPLAAKWRDVFAPELRIEELVEGDQFVVRVEAPGVDPDEDVDLSIEDGVLGISVRRRESRREEDEGTYLSEFGYGMLHRSIPLPGGADAEDVKATYSDGILEIRMPAARTEPAATKIPVTRT